MRIEISDEQLELLMEAVRTRIDQLAKSQDRQAPEGSQDELVAWRELAEQLERQHREEREKEAWRGYTESRQVPSNPPPIT